MLVGVLFHRGLYHHQPPSSVLGDITPYQCLFGSPPDYENIILFLLCLYTCPATSEACTSCKQMFFKRGMPRLRKAFDVLILLLVFDGPASYLPWARVLLLPPTYFSRRLLDQHLLDLLHQWFFLRLPCIRGSQSPKGIRVAALYWAASTCTSLFLIIKSSLHLYHLLVTTSCLRIILHPLSQQSHLHLCAWMVLPRSAAKEKCFLARDIRRKKRMTRCYALFSPKKRPDLLIFL